MSSPAVRAAMYKKMLSLKVRMGATMRYSLYTQYEGYQQIHEGNFKTFEAAEREGEEFLNDKYEAQGRKRWYRIIGPDGKQLAYSMAGNWEAYDGLGN